MALWVDHVASPSARGRALLEAAGIPVELQHIPVELQPAVVASERSKRVCNLPRRRDCPPRISCRVLGESKCQVQVRGIILRQWIINYPASRASEFVSKRARFSGCLVYDSHTAKRSADGFRWLEERRSTTYMFRPS
jgi:hypothetical protein